MKTELLELLRCPKTGQRLSLENGDTGPREIDEGWLVSADGRERYPVLKGEIAHCGHLVGRGRKLG